MNNPQERLGKLLSGAPFDDAYRIEHRDEVRQRALRAYDAAAAADSAATIKRIDASRQSFPRRTAVRAVLIAAVAACVGAVLVAWYGRDDNAATRPDEQLIAALRLVSEFDEESDAAAFDLGVQVCLAQYDSRMAAALQQSLNANKP